MPEVEKKKNKKKFYKKLSELNNLVKESLYVKKNEEDQSKG